MGKNVWSAAMCAAVGVVSFLPAEVEACGCFVPPDPTVPVVQAGERILFSVENGVVTSHVQIQYAGNGGDFGWLLPLPSVPTLELGTDELFTQLINTTQPRYFLDVVRDGNCSDNFNRGFGPQAASDSTGAGGPPSSEGGYNPLVVQDSIGPYDYAVLKADRKDEMLQWLNDNRYFVPAGTDATVGNYIRPGAFFLALKLQSGKTAGDLQPVVLTYPSDLPMIPIILTSVAAQPNMGIQVWMLGEGRAIPRNFNHVVVNDALVDWVNQARNYNDVIIKAVGEAPGKHAFVTEYAGTAEVMRNVLNAPGRFGTQAELATQATPELFLQYLYQHGYTVSSGNNGFFFNPVFNAQVKAVLAKYIPVPAGFTDGADAFYSNYGYYTGTWREQHPEVFAGWTLDYRPSVIAQELFTAVVAPVLAAGAVFDRHSTLTRLYSTLSPEDMNKDPVFSYNASLPQVSRDHRATLTAYCGLSGHSSFDAPAVLLTEQGWVIDYPNGRQNPPATSLSGLPGALQIETLREEGPAEILTDSRPQVGSVVGRKGCSVSGAAPLLLAALALVVRRRRSA
jgi:hypothetical protein